MPLTRTLAASVAGQSSGRRTVAAAKNRCSLATLDLPYVKARQIFDSRGTPPSRWTSASTTGASRGELHWNLRGLGAKRLGSDYLGKGVLKLACESNPHPCWYNWEARQDTKNPVGMDVFESQDDVFAI